MQPAPPADRVTLIRRLYFDLVGMPPTPAEMDEFVDDDAADAWERLIDKLLDDPRYGEHWARYWLDLVRYADSDGWNQDAFRPHIWRYRDYVVRAFNEDNPYPQFVQEQLAGDEMADDHPDRLAAAGFLRLDIQACFHKPVAERTSWEHQMAYLITRQFLEEGDGPLKNITPEDKAKYEALNKELAAFDRLEPQPLPALMTVTDFAGAIAPTVIPEDPQQRPISPGFPTVLTPTDPDASISLAALSDSSGRRTALAKWIGRPDNPLTTRVIVNRIWQEHFGQGIVPTANDFGHLGRRWHQPCGWRVPDEYLYQRGRTTFAGRVGELRSGDRQSGPASVCGDVRQLRATRQRSPQLGRRIHAGIVSGSADQWHE